MNSKYTIISAREQIQENLMCFLDGEDNDMITQVCQIVVDGFKPLLEEK